MLPFLGPYQNTRETYGFLLKDENGKPYVKNEGVQDLSGLDKVQVYAGFAQNVITGSGITVKLLPVTTINMTSKTFTTSTDAAFGIEGITSGNYALEISDYKQNRSVYKVFTLKDTSTEIRTYDGTLQPRGYFMSYDEEEDKAYYYIGDITENIYLDNHEKEEGKAKLVSGSYYSVKLVSADSLPVYHQHEWNGVGSSVTFEINTDSDEINLTENGNNIVYSRGFTDLSTSNKHAGTMSLKLTGVKNKNLNYEVEFQEWDGSQWKTIYDESKCHCVIDLISTGNDLLNYSIKPWTEWIPLRFFYNTDKPIKAIITFTAES